MNLIAWWIVSLVGAGLIGYGVGRRSPPWGRPRRWDDPSRCDICGAPATELSVTAGRSRCPRHPLGFGSGW